MKIMIRIRAFLLLFNICASFAFAQLPEVKTNVDTNNVLIGSRINLTFELNSDNKVNADFPLVADTIGSLEVMNRSLIDTITANNKFILRQIFSLTSFDSGSYSIPSFTFNLRDDNGEINHIVSEPLSLSFTTVEVDTTADIKDIKGPLDEPVSWLEFIEYIIAAIALIALAILAWYLWKKYRKKPEPELDYDPNIPPHIMALDALKQLDDEKLWQNGFVKKYYVRLTDIIRLYIKRRFSINAMEMITSEIINALTTKELKIDLIKNMNDLFNNADFAKFAKFQPLPDVNARCMTLALNFVKDTMNENPTEEDIHTKVNSGLQIDENLISTHDEANDKSSNYSDDRKNEEEGN